MQFSGVLFSLLSNEAGNYQAGLPGVLNETVLRKHLDAWQTLAAVFVIIVLNWI